MQVKGPNAGCGTHHFCSPGAKHAHGLPGVITFPSSLVSDSLSCSWTPVKPCSTRPVRMTELQNMNNDKYFRVGTEVDTTLNG